MAQELTQEQFERVQHLQFTSEDELLNAIETPPTDIDGETVAALGGGYPLGGITLPPPTLGILPLLEMIESPLLDGAVQDYGQMDLARALHVWANGQAAVEPVMAIVRRRAALERQRPLAEKSPEMFAVFLNAVDAVEQGWIEFDKAALTLWAQLGEIPMTDIANTIGAAFNQAFAGLAAMPGGEGEAEKKSVSMTLNG